MFRNLNDNVGNVKENRNYIGWIESRAMMGHDVFTKDDFVSAFAGTNDRTLEVALSRLMESGRVMSPWQNFYVIVPTEYKLKGVIPHPFYIDQLMSFLRRNYYVGLLSAASIYGAGHQRAQTFYVVADGTPLRSGIRNGTKVMFIRKKNIPLPYVKQVKTQTGTMNVSSALMTALDVICMEKRIGGMSRAAEVIAEMVESIVFSDDDIGLIEAYPTPVIQRFGYILSLLGEKRHSDWLHEACVSAGITFHHIPLKAGKKVDDGCGRDKQWKIIVNNDVNIDEL